jgi:TIR domain
MRKRLFFSYSHKDERLRDQLETHLAMLKRQGFIETWHDRRIVAGERIDEAISANLESAEIVLLLVSPDFLASDYCYDREMTRAIERHQAKLATVIPVIVRPCDWHDAPFGNLLAAPKDGKPITQWSNIDTAFLDVTTAIKAASRKRDGGAAKVAKAPAASAAPVRTDNHSEAELKARGPNGPVSEMPAPLHIGASGPGTRARGLAGWRDRYPTQTAMMLFQPEADWRSVDPAATELYDMLAALPE